MEEKKEKRVLNNELDENVKKASVTGLGDDETVVMSEELDEDDLDQATGGVGCRSDRQYDVIDVEESLQRPEQLRTFKPEILIGHING